jgi:hypothetical protein
MKQKMGLALPPGTPASGGQSLPGTAQGALGTGSAGGAQPGRDAHVSDAELLADDGDAHAAQERSAFPPLPPLPGQPGPGQPGQAQAGGVVNDRDLAAQIDALNRGA